MKFLKGALKSWTMWFNGIMAAALAAAPVLLETLPSIQEYVGGDIYKNLMAIALVGNAILRVKTKSSLTDK